MATTTPNAPAFPRPASSIVVGRDTQGRPVDEEIHDSHDGMSLLEWYAGQALAGLLASPSFEPRDPDKDLNAEADNVAAIALAYAQAMLRALEKGELS